MWTLASWLLLAAPPAKPAVGEVTLPLRDYVTLVEKVEALEAARGRAAGGREPSVAELLSQRVSLTVNESDADVVAGYEVEIRGGADETVSLPFEGIAHSITVEPPGPAGVQSVSGGLALAAPTPGRYVVRVSGKIDLVHRDGAERVALGPMLAPVAELLVSLPADRAWKCPGAVVAEEGVVEGRRQLRLAMPRGEPGGFEVRRETKPAELAETLASAVVVTLVGLERDGVRRHDVVLYEVQRGEMGTMAVTLPPGLEVDGVASDEGEATPWIEGRVLRVERLKKLTATGYLAVLSRPQAKEAIPLDAVSVEGKVRARYLAYSSDIAAAVGPEPAASWARADVTDLPSAVRDSAGALGIVAAWRLRPNGVPGVLKAVPLPGPRMLEGVVRRRDTTTLLTVENTLVHREHFVFDALGPSFPLDLPANATIWSSEVDGVPVRPVESSGRVLIPLGLASSARTDVQVVIVQQQSVPAGRSTLDLALAQVQTPVLRHDWRVLLPARNRYRFERGELAPVRGREGVGTEGEAGAGKKAVTLGLGGTAEVIGRVVDPQGSVLPGASVELVEQRTGRTLRLLSDQDGEFRFAMLPSGRYRLRCEMPGFKSEEYRDLQVGSHERQAYVVTLSVGSLAESVSVQPSPLAALPPLSKTGSAEERAASEAQADFQDQASLLKQGLVGGVRPVPVTIPESGKVLLLSGALPPVAVHVELSVKAPKD